MLRFLFVAVVLFPLSGLAQIITDDFEDGNFLNPTWVGDTSEFLQPTGILQSNGPAATSTLSISTAIPSLQEMEWRIDLEYPFAPSTSNYIRYYLSSDSTNLEGDLQGYYVQTGESGSSDSYDLFRQDGGTSVKIIDGIDDRAANQILASMRVRRSVSGSWTLETDTGAGIWQSEGTAVDQTYSISGHSGIFVRHSSTRNQSFTFDNLYMGGWELDTLAPEVLLVQTNSENELIVQFTEAIDSSMMITTSNYVVDQGVGSPFFAQWQSTSSVLLEFAAPFADGQQYQLTVSNLEDLSGNVITSSTNLPFFYSAPIQYYFGMVRFNEVHFDPTPSVSLPEVEYLELLNLSDDFLNMQGWRIGVTGEGNLIDSAGLGPGDLLLLTDEDDLALFPNVTITSLGPWVTLSNSGLSLFLKAPDGTIVDTFTYGPSFFSIAEKADGGYSLERINPNNFNCPPIVNWDGSVDPTGGTPGRENSLYDPLYDQTLASPVSAIVTSDNTLQVCFSHPMDRTSLDDPEKFILEGFNIPDEVFIEEPFAQCVTLFFGGTIPLGQEFTLRIVLQGSCFGNGPQESTIQVIRGIPVQPDELLINEIMADETPSRGLPEREYVEVYNATSTYLDISNGGISDGGAIKSWGNAQLAPGAYAIIVDRDDSLVFRPFGTILAVDGLPSLNNRGDLISITDQNGTVLNEVVYSSNWYNDLTKADGGFSLEKINKDLSVCNFAENWRATQASIGGTPGSVNSVDGPFEDTVVPSVLFVRFDGPQTIVLTFSEKMDIGIEEVSKYLIQETNQTPLVATLSQNEEEIFLLFDTEFTANEQYTLILTDLFDCSGNTFSDQVRVGLPIAADAGDILISEVLFNPFSGGVDFVEIYNTSEKILSLGELSIGEIFEGTDSIYNSDQVAFSDVLIFPDEYLCLTSNVEIQKATYLPPSDAKFLEMSSFPTYDDTEGEVVIFTGTNFVIDRFFYLDDYHYADLRDDNGISLERISFSVPTNQADNWHSAASTVRFATPGYENSQAQRDRQDETGPLVGFPDVITPDGDGIDDVFNISYQFEQPGMNARVTILDRAGRVVKTVREQELLGTGEGTFFWDGRSDAGSRVPIGPYIVLFEVTSQQTGSRELYRFAVVVGS